MLSERGVLEISMHHQFVKIGPRAAPQQTPQVVELHAPAILACWPALRREFAYAWGRMERCDVAWGANIDQHWG